MRYSRLMLYCSSLLAVLFHCVAFNAFAEDQISEGLASYAKGINREMDLAEKEFIKTNASGYSVMDTKVCKSLPLNPKVPTLVHYEQISLIVHYPTTNECAGSATEMDLPDDLICKKGSITRTNSTRESPLNYIRIVDPGSKHVMAEVDLLIGMTPEGSSPMYFRRAFRYSYDNGWKEANGPAK